jgi:hypothetical protein
VVLNGIIAHCLISSVPECLDSVATELSDGVSVNKCMLWFKH